MGAHDELLERFMPALRYDSGEQYFADSAAQFTEAPGVTLRRADGTVLASAGGTPRLSLAFLDPTTYAGGEPVQETDVIGVHGKDYAEQYVKLRVQRPDLRNRIYGRAVEANGRLWLQYWAWYFYNDYRLALNFGLHEGDWECVQLRMSPAGDVPDVAVYAQHRHGERRAWESVEKVPGSDTPVVYVGRGSHAAYFERGYHQTDAFYDLADGRRPAPPLTLEIVEANTHPWLRWPGHWGDTVPPPEDKLDLAQASPTGPGMKKQWRNPDALLNNAKPSKVSDPPPAPDVLVRRDEHDLLELTYDFSQRPELPHALLVTVNSRDEKGVPPFRHTFEELEPSGTFGTDVALHPDRHYDVYTSTVGADPSQYSGSQLTEIEPVGAQKPTPLGQRLAQAFGRSLARLRGDLR